MEAHVSLNGWVGTDVDLRPAQDQVPSRASFRVASTPRFLRQGQWQDGNTTWLTVKCFRALADNAAASLHKGSPVLVTGRLRTEVWDDPRTGERQERLILEATSIGHDLTLGTTRFSRGERPAGADSEGRDDPARELTAA